MAYIETGVNQPGLVELLFYKGSTGKPLANLVHALLHGPSGLSRGERELIAAYVSDLNECDFCRRVHTAATDKQMEEGAAAVSCAIAGTDHSVLNPKMKTLLNIAAKVQRSGKAVTASDVEVAKNNGAGEEDIHDTVLIAAAFCMYNRYIDGLGAKSADPQEVSVLGERFAKKGYKYPPLFLRRFVVWMMNRKQK